MLIDKVLATPPIIASLTWRVDRVTGHDPVVWVVSLLMMLKMSHSVSCVHICTRPLGGGAVAGMIQMSNLKLSYDKMDAVKETLSQTFPAVQSTVVSVKDED